MARDNAENYFGIIKCLRDSDSKVRAAAVHIFREKGTSRDLGCDQIATAATLMNDGW